MVCVFPRERIHCFYQLFKEHSAAKNNPNKESPSDIPESDPDRLLSLAAWMRNLRKSKGPLFSGKIVPTNIK